MAQQRRPSKRKARRDNQRRSLIRNMGLFWRMDLVEWAGVANNPAVLWGKQANERSRAPINFWDQSGVYALYADYQLVYVGQTGASGGARLGGRLKKHTRDHLAGRWDRFSWFGFRGVTRRMRNRELEPLDKSTKSVKWTALADVVEGLLIEVAEPPLNGQGGPWGKRIHRYLQVPSPHLEAAKAKDPVRRGLNKLERLLSPANAKILREQQRLAKQLIRIEERLKAHPKRRRQR